MRHLVALLSITALLATAGNAQAFTCGDVDNEPGISLSDVLTILHHTTGRLTIEDLRAGDANGDERVSVVDALVLLHWWVGYEGVRLVCPVLVVVDLDQAVSAVTIDLRGFFPLTRPDGNPRCVLAGDDDLRFYDAFTDNVGTIVSAVYNYGAKSQIAVCIAPHDWIADATVVDAWRTSIFDLTYVHVDPAVTVSTTDSSPYYWP